jgi:hypothetical protein
MIVLGTTKVVNHVKKIGDVQLAPAAMLHSIIKPSFHDWDLDFVGQIHPASYKGH